MAPTPANSKIKYKGGRNKGFSFIGPVTAKEYLVVIGEELEVDNKDLAQLPLSPDEWDGIPATATKSKE